MKDLLTKFIKFGLVGVLNTIANQVIFMLCIHFNIHYIVANAVAFIISVLHAFLWQYNLVFKSEEKEIWWKALLKTYVSYASTGLLLNSLLMIMWVDIIHIQNYTEWLTNIVNNIGINISNSDLATDITPLLNMCVTIPLNFILNNFWAYKTKKAK